jgi:hypothetical protein
MEKERGHRGIAGILIDWVIYIFYMLIYQWNFYFLYRFEVSMSFLKGINS